MTPAEEALRRAKPRPDDDDTSYVVIGWLAVIAGSVVTIGLVYLIWETCL